MCFSPTLTKTHSLGIRKVTIGSIKKYCVLSKTKQEEKWRNIGQSQQTGRKGYHIYCQPRQPRREGGLELQSFRVIKTCRKGVWLRQLGRVSYGYKKDRVAKFILENCYSDPLKAVLINTLSNSREKIKVSCFKFFFLSFSINLICMSIRYSNLSTKSISLHIKVIPTWRVNLQFKVAVKGALDAPLSSARN